MSVQPLRFELDSNARRDTNGTALLGGSPFRVLTLTQAGARLVDGWLNGSHGTETPSAEAGRLLRRLLDSGIVHPVVDPVPGRGLAGIGFVVPVFEDAAGLNRLLPGLRAAHADAPVVVVDDGSRDVGSIEAAASRHGAYVVRHAENQGPAAARNTGWRDLLAGTPPTDVVVFVDSDCRPQPEAVATMVAHFADPQVVAVAPRIRAERGETPLARYEAARSPLDLGASRALVRSGSAVPYVPSAMLAVRISALVAADGFDPDLRVGEDVDLVWRLVAQGGAVRYEPDAVVWHRNRSSWLALVRQRFGYGTGAAPLQLRHPGAVTPIDTPPSTLAVWTLIALGGRVGAALGLLVAGRDADRLRRQLAGRVDDPAIQALRLSARGHAHAARWLSAAVTRVWLPVAVAASGARRARRVLTAALVVPAIFEWLHHRPRLDPVRYLAARALDDASYCAGVWRGVAENRNLGPLLPKVQNRP